MSNENHPKQGQDQSVRSDPQRDQNQGKLGRPGQQGQHGQGQQGQRGQGVGDKVNPQEEQERDTPKQPSQR
jgi:hypothetical protein